MPGGVHPPLSVIGSWPHPNYTNPHTSGYQVVIATVVLGSLAITTVIARLYARIVLLRNPGWDDYLIVISLIPSITLAILACLAEQKYGFNRHVWDLPLDMAVEGRKISMAMQAVYDIACTLIKLSTLMLLRRITNGVHKFYTYAVWFIMAVAIAYFFVFELTLFNACRPLNAYWNQVHPIWAAKNEGTYTCFNEAANIMAASAGAILTDFMIFLLPLILFRTLQVPFKQKFALGCIFGVGFLLCIAGTMRVVVTYETFYTTYDVTWVGQKIYFWTIFEIFLGIVCASLPSLKIFFGHYFDANRSKASKGFSGYSGFSDRSGRKQNRRHSISDDPLTTETDIELEKGIMKTTSHRIESTKLGDNATAHTPQDFGQPSAGSFFDNVSPGVTALPLQKPAPSQ